MEENAYILSASWGRLLDAEFHREPERTWFRSGSEGIWLKGKITMSDEAFSRQQKYQLVQEDYYGTVEYYDERYDTTVEFGAAFSDFITVLPPNAVVLDIGSGR